MLEARKNFFFEGLSNVQELLSQKFEGKVSRRIFKEDPLDLPVDLSRMFLEKVVFLRVSYYGTTRPYYILSLKDY